MESNLNSNSGICPVCHQPILPTYYFCPNCGVKLITAPLSTTIGTQLGIYLFSIILPMICFIFVTRWQGLKYVRSADPKAKQIGWVAWGLLILSTVVIIWLVTIQTQALIKELNDSLNASLGAFGL